jgi:hypothetical protein
MKESLSTFTKTFFHCNCSENSVWLDLQILYFKLQVIYKSYRQVLTPVNNAQLLLKLEILDKLRLVTFHKNTIQRKIQHFNWLNLVQEKWEFSLPWTIEHQCYNARLFSMPMFSLLTQHKLCHLSQFKMSLSHSLLFGGKNSNVQNIISNRVLRQRKGRIKTRARSWSSSHSTPAATPLETRVVKILGRKAAANFSTLFCTKWTQRLPPFFRRSRKSSSRSRKRNASSYKTTFSSPTSPTTSRLYYKHYDRKGWL